MRALMHVDVVTLARVLLGVNVLNRAAVCDRVFYHAHAADKYRKRFGRDHMQYGTGSLASACWDLEKRPELFLSDRDYAHCMKVIFDCVMLRKGSTSGAGDTGCY